MMPEFENRLDELFDRAVELDGSERERFIERECGGDARLAAALRRLLRHHGETSDAFLEGGAALDGAEMPEWIGGYRVIREIGRGGMGVVYEAEQERPRRRVALKVVHDGAPRGQTLKRFEQEAQVLGRLQHPGIAHIYEAGSTEVNGNATPFFAMEFIDGFPLDRFVRERGLTRRDVLELMARVCDAVEHAHQMGVIHRDLKPANILVKGDRTTAPSKGESTFIDAIGQPKILDFGVARLTDSDLQAVTVQTNVGQIIGTLSHMSPEQVAGRSEDLDTRCDTYAIGVILYELLAGRAPHELGGKSIAEVGRIIREEEPAKLGGVDAQLRGDLETIVAKAMEKDRDRRYASAGALGEDLRRHLRSEPILARAPSAMYQLRKFAARNRGLVAGVAVAFVVLILGVVGTGAGLVSAVRANRELKQTNVRLTETNQELDLANLDLSESYRNLEEVAMFQSRNLGDINLEVMGVRLRDSILELSPETDRSALQAGMAGLNFTDIALKALDQNIFSRSIDTIDADFRDQPEVRAMLLQSVATTMRGVGLFDRALAPQQEAVDIRSQVLGKENPRTLESIESLALLKRDLGAFDEAAALLEMVVDSRRVTDGEVAPGTITAEVNLGLVRVVQSDLQGAETICREAYERASRALGDDDPVTFEALQGYANTVYEQGRSDDAEPLLREVWARCRATEGDDSLKTATAAHNLGAVCADLGQFDDAERFFNRALEIRRRKLGDAHPSVVSVMSQLAGLYGSKGRLEESRALYEECYEMRRSALGTDHPNTLNAANNLATVLDTLGLYTDAEKIYKDTLAVKRRIHGNEHRSTLITLGNLAYVINAQGHAEESLPYYQEMVLGMRRTLGDDNPNTLQAIQNYGVTLASLERLEEAEPLYRESLEGRRRLLGDDHLATLNGVYNMGNLLLREGKLDEAEPFCEGALEGYRRVGGDDHIGTIYSLGNLAELRVRQDRLDDAEALFREQYERRSRILGHDHPETIASARRLAEILDDLGRGDEAEALRGPLPSEK
ncbi:MAG: serine/threonine-protein kinase [Phycisphaerales bacterium]